MKLLLFNDLDWFGLIWPLLMYKTYSIVKDSILDLEVIFKFLQNEKRLSELKFQNLFLLI